MEPHGGAGDAEDLGLGEARGGGGGAGTAGGEEEGDVAHCLVFACMLVREPLLCFALLRLSFKYNMSSMSFLSSFSFLKSVSASDRVRWFVPLCFALLCFAPVLRV